MLRWGLSTNDSCECGAEQTADHITSGRCPIYRPPEGINGLIVLDDETRAWLENNTLDVWGVRDGTRKKKKWRLLDKRLSTSLKAAIGQSIWLILEPDPKQIATETISPVLIQEIYPERHIKNII